jgi:hypothetical protein
VAGHRGPRFQALARVSMQTNSKVRDIAGEFVQTGECDGQPR